MNTINSGESTSHRNVYEIVTEQIIRQLEQGVAPWRKPWRTELPVNLVSGKPYRGLNVFLLRYQGYGSRYWLTFNQAAKLGGPIRKGERSSLVTFWHMGEEKIIRDADGNERKSKDSLMRRPGFAEVSRLRGEKSMKLTQPLFFVAIVVVGVFASPKSGVPAPKSDEPLPTIAAAAVPLYPRVALLTLTQGAIHVQVSTDGHQVTAAHAKENLKPLSSAAEENAKTWKFVQHTPTTFTITYEYKLSEHCGVNDPTVTLWLPDEIQVCQYPYREY